jgi:AraC-like DNA-binding protein
MSAPWSLRIEDEAPLTLVAVVRGHVRLDTVQSLAKVAGVSRATLEVVAHQVGYASPYALSIAFKRVRGVSPQQYRAAARSPA